MKKFLALFLIVVLCMGMCGCSEESRKENNNVKDNNEQMGSYEDEVALTELTSKDIGFDKIDFNGNENVQHLYYFAEVDYNPAEYFYFRYNGNEGYINQNGEVVIENQFSYGSVFSEGKCFVKKDDDIHIIDTKGNILFTLPSKYHGSVDDWYYINGTAFFILNDKYNEFHFVTIDDAFNIEEHTVHFQSGFSIINKKNFKGVLATTQDNGKDYIVLYNNKGELVWKGLLNDVKSSCNSALDGTNISISHGAFYELEKMISVNEGYASVLNENQKWGIIDANTKQVVVDYTYDFIGAVSEGVAPVCNKGNWGVIDLSGKLVVETNYKYISTFANDRAFAIDSDSNYCLINKNGEVVYVFEKNEFPSSNDIYFYPFTEGGFAYVKTGDYATDGRGIIVSHSGDILLDMPSETFRVITNEYIAVNGCLYKVD